MEYKNKKRIYDYFNSMRVKGEEEKVLLAIMEEELTYHDIAWANVCDDDIADVLGEKDENISEEMIDDIATIMGDNYQDSNYGVDLREAIQEYISKKG